MKVCQLACYYHTNNLYGRLFGKLAGLDVEQRVVSGRDFKRDTPKHPLLSYHSKRLWDKLDAAWLPRKTRKYCEFVEQEVGIESCSLIHAHTLYSDGFTALQMSRKHGIPYLITVRNTDVNLFARFAKHLSGKAVQVLQNASHIVFVNHHYREKLEHYLKVTLPDDKCHVIPNGMENYWIDSTEVSKPSNEEGLIRLISVANIIPLKNLELIVNAVKTHNSTGKDDVPRLQLTLVGDHSTPYGQKLKKAEESEDVIFAGPKNAQEIHEILLKQDILVLVSHRENFGVVYIEAMSMGVPTIYTRGQGMDGWATDGEWGYACSPRSTEELLTHIMTLGNQRRLTADQIDTVKKTFSWDTIAPQFLQLYESTESGS